MKVLGISCSPRPGSNSHYLLQKFMEGVAEVKCSTEIVSLRQLTFSPCIGCESCAVTGKCRFDDDLTSLFGQIRQNDALVIAAPVFFLGINALGKGMIDRAQMYWFKKYGDNKPADQPPLKPAYFISTAGAPKDSVFSGSLKTIDTFFDVLYFNRKGQLLVNSVDRPSDILNHPDMLEKAKSLGRSFIEEHKK